jgi:CRISPR/Cas system-associated protein Cas10 (large subunit of type III CRISPR-Cas system)
VKDENKWEKEGNDNIKVRKAIKVIAKKNSKLLYQFKEKHPDCINSDSRYSEQYNKLLIESYGGKENEDIENENKIIKNISKEVFIDKTYI